MRLAELLARNDGFVTRAELRRAGYSAHSIRSLLDHGTLVALTRDILGRPSTAPAFQRAVRMGGRVACVTAAYAMGIWVLDQSAFHVVHTGVLDEGRIVGLFPDAVIYGSAFEGADGKPAEWCGGSWCFLRLRRSDQHDR